MLAKFPLFSLFAILLFQPLMAQQTNAVTVQMNKMQLRFSMTEKDSPQYAVSYAGEPVVKPSGLGSKFTDGTFFDNFEITGIDSSVYDKSWEPVLGEVSMIRDHHKELIIHLKQKMPPQDCSILFSGYLKTALGFATIFQSNPV